MMEWPLRKILNRGSELMIGALIKMDPKQVTCVLAKLNTSFIVQISDGNLLDFTTCLGTCTVQEGRVGNPDDVSGATAAALESRGRGREEKDYCGVDSGASAVF
ncbi:uncharacterized protein LOC120633435 [Pararge aegeria]|uniref:uncharacterized protein LOC120625177 n=1 Tax=Pararge aegeria TaxID=116150 RepID=UPI0019D049C6|nr:uncharacterized protein LOC120625177 [Pararge aegeria]XP_039754244.1 uncharacterized protein LOC120629379 [Pararge aegeria]XP_039755413.1 uncharacterized protein LOC120630297 [Pararge aegeria]XP_039755614.1 uncharacterized protein LOC120630444 [Pararge aegeria]XP_039759580.1 uncharacterized protein LOC120633435 [Pararge aegeria]